MADSVPNPFMSDYPEPTSQSESGLGLNVEINSGVESQGGDLFSAGGQADLFGGDHAALTDDNVAGPTDVAAMDFAAASVGQAAIVKVTATPPPRPPPPASANNCQSNGHTPRTMSPAVPVGGGAGVVQQAQQPKSKSAFDDLNDSIRMALGGSPSRSAPLNAQQAAPAQQQQQQQPGFASFDGVAASGIGAVAGQQPSAPAGGPMLAYGVAPNQTPQIPVGYGSPAKQPISGDGRVHEQFALL